jgi:antitoxin component of RelBE/YafQ-DinJ toxin-antitoxin module
LFLTEESLLATFSYYEAQVNPFLWRKHQFLCGSNLCWKNQSRSDFPFFYLSSSNPMIHHQISVKFDDKTHNEITRVAEKMRITPHKFIVTSVQEMQQMIEDRGKEKLPLLVALARRALDYAKETPSLPVPSNVGPPEQTRETLESKQQKNGARTKSKPVSRRAS